MNHRQTIAGNYRDTTTPTGKVDNIAKTLATDNEAKDKLLNAYSDGKLDFGKIDQRDLDKFRDQETGELDLDRLQQTAADLIEEENNDDTADGSRYIDQQDRTDRPSTGVIPQNYDNIIDTLRNDPNARETLKRAVVNGKVDFTQVGQEVLERFKDPSTGGVDYDKLE